MEGNRCGLFFFGQSKTRIVASANRAFIVTFVNYVYVVYNVKMNCLYMRVCSSFTLNETTQSDYLAPISNQLNFLHKNLL